MRRNRPPGKRRLQSCEESPAPGAARWRRDVLGPQVAASPGRRLHITSGFCGAQREQPRCQQAALRPALAVSPPKPSSRSPFPCFQSSPAAPSRVFLSLIPPPGSLLFLAFPREIVGCCSSMLSSVFLLPFLCSTLFTAICCLVKSLRRPGRSRTGGVSTAPEGLHPPPGQLSAAGVLGLQGGGSLRSAGRETCWAGSLETCAKSWGEKRKEERVG